MFLSNIFATEAAVLFSAKYGAAKQRRIYAYIMPHIFLCIR